MIDVLDRVVENPHRYQLIAVPGETNTYDIVAKPGTVTEEGTPINKALFNAIQSDIPMASYMAFCGNVNTDMLDAAFGRGNEDKINGLGRQLAMYAWFKGDNKTTHPFTNLKTRDTFLDCCIHAYSEIRKNTNLLNLIVNSPFARERGSDYIPMAGDYPINTVSPNAITTTTGGALNTITVPVTGYYRVKFAHGSPFGDGGTVSLKKNGVEIYSSNAEMQVYSEDFLLFAGDVLSLSSTAPAVMRTLITTPIILCTQRKINIPTNPVQGNRIALLDLVSDRDVGTTLIPSGGSLIIEKSGTYSVRFKMVCLPYTQNGTYSMEAHIYKNGASVYNVSGMAPGYSTGNPLVLNGDTTLTLSAGDKLQLYKKAGYSDSFMYNVGFTVACSSTDAFPN